jgi:hypothetical protein
MELTELQDIWKNQDEKLSKSIRLNRMILKKIILTRPEKRLRRMKIEIGIGLVVPIFFIPFMYYQFHFRNNADFFIGLSIFLGLLIFTYIQRIKHFQLANKINFSDPVLFIKKNINKLEKYQMKMLRLMFLIMPLGFFSIFLIEKLPILTTDTLVPLTLMIVILVATYFFKGRYTYVQRFRKLNQEIEEIEELEKEQG